MATTTSASVTRDPLLSHRLILSLFLLGSCVFLYLDVFILPDVPRAATGDQAIYLHDGERMLEGQLIYRDYDHFAFPGTDFLYATIFKVVGVRAWVPQAMLVLVGVLLAWLSVLIAGHLMAGPIVFLPALVFLTFPFTSYLDATHHWYSALASTAALAVLIPERSPVRLTCAGVLWGVATCFAQSLVIGMLGVVFFVTWEHRRKHETWPSLLKKQAYLVAGYLGTVVAFLVPFVAKAGFGRFLYFTVVFVAKYYTADRFNRPEIYMTTWPAVRVPANWPDLPAWPLVHFLVPLIYVLFFIWYWRHTQLKPEIPWERLMLVNVTGVSLFLTVASGPTWNRLYTVSLPATILLVWFLNLRWRVERVLRHALWACTLALIIVKPIVTQTRWKAFLNLPTGRTAFLTPSLFEQTKWIQEHTRPGNYFFGDQFICFALRLRNPTPVPFVRPTDYTRPEEVENVIRALQQHRVQLVGWYYGLDPSIPSPGDHLQPLRSYLHDHYRLATTFSNGYKVWARAD